MRIAVLATVQATEEALARAFLDEGWEPPSPGNPHQVELSLHAHQRGCVIREVWATKLGWDETVGARFARAIVDAGGWVLFVSPGLEETRVTEWDAEGPSARTVPSPVVTARGVEQKEDRIAKAQIDALAVERIGAPTRARVRRLEFRRKNRAPVDEVLAAVERGQPVSEMTVQGKPAFRFPSEGGTRILVLTPEEGERVRAAVREARAD